MRQAFLLKLSDALRPLGDANAIRATACRLLGRHLGASRAYYADYEVEAGYGLVADDYAEAGLASVSGRYPFDTFRTTYLRMGQGTTWVVPDIALNRDMAPAEREIFTALGVIAWVVVPLVKDGRFRAAICVVQARPRAWRPAEIELIEDVAERLWADVERARAEAHLRESEARFQQFAAFSSTALWIRDAATLAMEYVSPAIETIYGVEAKELLGDPRRWAAMVVPEDRAAALDHLEKARRGEEVVHEFRILRAADGAFRWIRNTDFPLFDAEGRVQRVGGIAEDVTEAKQAADHQSVLLFELQHRVRNIMAMIRSIADRTGDTVADVGDYRARLEGRLRALAHVQVLLTRNANAGVDLKTLIRDEVEAQADHAGQFVLSGPELMLAPKAAEVVTLAIHELTTNALKYGVLAGVAGQLEATWAIEYEAGEPWLRFEWRERRPGDGVAPPVRRGFGTMLIEQRIPYELRGRGHLDFRPDGLVCRLTFPLRRADSILETDAVTLSTTIEGGSLDMSGEADLSGCRILVVEDDFYLATDTERALRMAHAEVLGPVSGEDQALEIIDGGAPTAALVDINLGYGAQFRVADCLTKKGVPFVFVTGYDDVVIPERFQAVPRLRKPTDFRQVVRAAARMCQVAD